MREIIIFEGVEAPSPSTQKAPKDNTRRISSLQKQIEKMENSGLWKANRTNRRQRQLDSYIYRINALKKEIESLGGLSNSNTSKMVLENKIKGQMLKKIPGYFPTPEHIVKKMVELADIQDGDIILEPSAGTGSIVDGILETKKDVVVKALELNYSNIEILIEKYEGNDLVKVSHYDFLEYKTGGKDKILMNPPFENKQDMIHIMRAFELLNNGGILVAIASAGVTFRSDYEKFRDFITNHGYWQELPKHTFIESGTGVNSILIFLEKSRK